MTLSHLASPSDRTLRERPGSSGAKTATSTWIWLRRSGSATTPAPTDMADPDSRSRARLCCAYPRGPSARWISDGSDGLAFIRWGNSSMMMSPSPTSPNSRCSASSQSANAYRPPPVRSRLTRARPKLSSESISVESVGLVVHHDHGEVGQADGARVDDRLAVAALVQFRVAHQHEHPRRHKPECDQP